MNQAQPQALFSRLGSHPLGLLRFCLVGYLSLVELPRLLMSLAAANEIAAEFRHTPWILNYLPLPFPMPAEDIQLFGLGLLLLGILASLGVFTRVTLGLFSLGWIYLSASDSAWGWHDHGPSLICQVLLVLCFAPGAAAHSIDRYLWRRSRAAGESVDSYIGDRQAKRWGLTLILCLVALFYFTSGASKLRFGGMRWIDGSTLSFYLSGKSLSSHIQQLSGRESIPSDQKWRDGIGVDYYLYGARPNAIAKRLADSKPIMVVASISAVLIELLMPLILFSRRARALLLPAAAGFHIGVYYLMGISFLSWVVLDLCLALWSESEIVSESQS